MAKWLKLSATITFSTLHNLRHRTSLLNTDVPNCHITLEFIICIKTSDDWIINLTITLSNSKLKYGSYNRAVSSTTYQLKIVRIYARNVPRVHWHKRVDDGATGRQRNQRSTG